MPISRSHILFITAHDLGRFLGCYGIATVRTPHLDAFARAGTRLTRAFATAPGCSPSRAAIATGRYPHGNGVLGLAHAPFGWGLAPDVRHVAAILHEAGYETHLFGLQHVIAEEEVNRLGFDHVHGRGAGRGVAAQVAALLSHPLPGRPRYLEVNLEEPHRPFDQGGVEPDDALGTWVPPYLPDDPATRADIAGLQGAIREADAAVGRILTALDEAKLAGATLVTFTTDHGIAMPRAKCTLYDAGIETALLLRWPGIGLQGGTMTDLVSNVDLLPTLLDAIGVARPAGLQGQSFLPALRGEEASHRDTVFAEKTFHSYYDPMRAVRTSRYKLIRNFETAFAVEVPGDVQVGSAYRANVARYVATAHPEIELYDLESDPWEERNLAGHPKVTEVQRQLNARLWRWMAETGDPLLAGPVASPRYQHAMRQQTD